MSHTINKSIENSAYEDQNLLASKRDITHINQSSETYQFEPGIVLDIVMDDTHPLFKSDQLGRISVPVDFPLNYKQKTPSSDDKNYFPIGSILVRLCYSMQKVEKENLAWAVPLDSNFSTYPVLNEVVHVVKVFNKYFYTNKINTKNFCNTSADFRYEQTYGKKVGNRSYANVELKGPESRLDSLKNEKSYLGFRGILGNYFWFNNKIRNLKRFEGDSIFESRFGQSIRMGAYDDNRKNDRGFYDNYKSGNDSFGGGNPCILIRNRQRPLGTDAVQNLHPLLNSIPIIPKNEVNVGGYMSEDVNNDGSSIHITSGLTISKFRTTCYKKYFSSNLGEEQTKFCPSGATSFSTPVFDKDQIVIHSDRLIFASRFNETLHFSKKRYAVTTDSEFTVDSHDQIVLTSNTKTVLNSPAIYLGEYNNTNEPALLGQTTVDWLYDLCVWLSKHTHDYKHTHPGGGGAASPTPGGGAASPTPGGGDASPPVTQIPVEIQELQELTSRLHRNLSRRVFLTGGGYAPGANGKPITDGKNPVSIENIESEVLVSGVPGGWTGRSRRLDAVFNDETVSAVESQLESFVDDVIQQYGDSLTESELTDLLNELIDQSLE